jgi:hypothetical protein
MAINISEYQEGFSVSLMFLWSCLYFSDMEIRSEGIGYCSYSIIYD